MKQPKIIPAFLNQLTYNERRYLLHITFAFILFGSWITYALAVSIPEMFANKFSISNPHFFIYCIILGLFMFETIQYKKYRELIKKEPSNKKPKELN